MFQDSGKHRAYLGFAGFVFQGNVDVEAVARFLFHRLRREIRIQPVLDSNRLYDTAEHHDVVGGGYRIGVADINLVLPGADLVVRAFRLNPHLFESEADFTPHILSAVIRSNIHVTCVVVGNLRGSPVLIQLKEIEFLFRTEAVLIACFLRVRNGFLQKRPRVARKRRSVRPGNRSKHLHDTAMLRSPRKRCKRLRLRMQEQIASRLISEARDSGCVDGNSLRKSSSQFIRHNRNVLLSAEYIAKSEADEFYILLAHVLDNLVHGVIH